MRARGRLDRRPPYDHQVIPPLAIGLALGLALLMLLPARRLQLADLDVRWIATYVVVLWALAMIVALRLVGARFLFPILLIAWVAPFVVAPERLGRILRRDGRAARLAKDVTPRGDRPDDPAPPHSN